MSHQINPDVLRARLKFYRVQAIATVSSEIWARSRLPVEVKLPPPAPTGPAAEFIAHNRKAEVTRFMNHLEEVERAIETSSKRTSTLMDKLSAFCGQFSRYPDFRCASWNRPAELQ